jgi:hypothetical protein
VVRKTKFKRLLLIGLGNLVSGMFFGTGCVIVEHIDNTWWQSEADSSDEEDKPKVAIADTEPVKGNSGRLPLANRRLFK